MNKFFRKLKKHWITVWLIMAVIAVGAFVAIASYTGIYSVKRVVSTKPAAGVLFSSNSMQGYSSAESIPSRHISTSQSEGDYTYTLTVCDFAQADPLTRYVSDTGIPYNMTAQLYVRVNSNYYPVNDPDPSHVSNAIKTDAGNKNFSIQFVSDGGESAGSGSDTTVYNLNTGAEVVYSSELIRPQASGSVIPNGTNKYEIIFDKYELTDNQIYDYYIKLTAHPTNNDATLQDIACYLYLTRSVAMDSAWSGRLQETNDTADYDAYNYILEGSGTGTVTFSWNSNYIEVSEIFLAQNGLTVETEQEDAHGNVWKHFDMEVGHENNGVTVNRYEIQLYKNNSSGDYSNVSSYIKKPVYVAD